MGPIAISIAFCDLKTKIKTNKQKQKQVQNKQANKQKHTKKQEPHKISEVQKHIVLVLDLLLEGLDNIGSGLNRGRKVV